jgi:PPOX class probable FMN-dependent enzyme
MDSVVTTDQFLVTTVEQLEALYGEPLDAAVRKQTNYIVEPGRAFIAASPFLLLATASEAGIDCSPKGDAPGFVQILDDRTLLIPDRPGNNRVDGMRNILANPRIGIIFMIPGADVTYRINGTASISIDPSLLDRFLVRGKRPRAVMVVTVEEAFHHCPKALVRSNLWVEGARGAPDHAPTSGSFAAWRDGGDDAYAKKYEADSQARLKDQLY